MSYRISPRLSLTAEARRVARAEIAEAAAILAAGRDRRGGNVHDARRRFKRLRGLYRLVAGLDREFCRRGERCIRDLARDLSAARDAAAIVEAVDRLAAEAAMPTEIGRLMTFRRGLAARRDQIAGRQAETTGAIDRALARLAEPAEALDILPDAENAAVAVEILSEGVGKTYRRGCEALARAVAHGRDEDFHDLRKAVKYHEMHMRLLRDGWPGPWRSRLALAESLGETLGRLHDIPVLQHTVDRERIGSRAEREALRKFLRRKKKSLAADCIESAARLFAADTVKLARDVASGRAEAAGKDAAFAS